MKLFLAICVAICAVGVYSEETSKIADRIGEKNLKEDDIKACSEKAKVDMKTLEEVNKSKVLPETPEMKCFMACMMKKDNLMNEDGTLSKLITESEIQKICKDLSGTDECDVAYKTIDCLIKNKLIEIKWAKA